jgi:hypothetical protein
MNQEHIGVVAYKKYLQREKRIFINPLALTAWV